MHYDPYTTLLKPILHPGQRLRNFEIRVGIDVEIGNNAICYKQLGAMEDGAVKNFSCYQDEFGNWISINKTEQEASLRYLHFREIRVFGELSKLV